MFLSRVEISWEAARNPYDWHRRIWKLFPGEPKETRKHFGDSRHNFLFRIEDHAPGRAIRLLLQSRSAPSPVDGPFLIGSREFQPQPAKGQRLGFSLTANPVKTIQDGQKNSKPEKASDKCRVPLIREEEQRAWLIRKLKDAAEVEFVDLRPQEPLYFRKDGRAGKLSRVYFNGILQVLDPRLFVALLENGIGPAKAFGCGLMLVRRL
ncbi:MAG TPA: type I-E CRISPR-associated protein Cas6/Cse3/CasE [Deltaproteobacteria bacterium]|nr:type I-E CRISPR-associated protein Cas6/Cse3/CasE [Deltaproteobacteria bacterium]